MLFFPHHYSALFPLRAPGCSPAAEERMQRGAGEVTGQYEGCSQVMNCGVMPGVAKYIYFLAES